MRTNLRLLLLPLLLLPGRPAAADTLVVANKAEATVSLIDLTSGEVVATLPAGLAPHEVGISPDGKRALITNYGNREQPGHSLTLIDVEDSSVIGTLDLSPYERPHGVVWTGADRAVVTAEKNKALLVVDLAARKVAAAIPTEQEISHMVAVSPDGTRAYVANIGSDSISVIDLDAGKLIRNVPTGEGAEGVAVSASGERVWVSNRAADTLSIVSAESLEVLTTFECAGFPIRVAAAPNGAMLVTRARAGDLVIYADSSDVERIAARGPVQQVSFDLESLGAEGRLFGDRFGKSSVPIGVVVEPTGDGTGRTWVAHANADLITETDTPSGRLIRTLKAGKEPDGMGWTPVSAKPR